MRSLAILLSAASLVSAQSFPDFILAFAPLSHIYSGEKYYPSDIASFVTHVTPEVSFTPIASSAVISSLSAFPTNAYLTSNDQITNNPTIDWITDTENIPNGDGLSTAPATIIAVNKTIEGEDVVDVFYFYFYDYNHGNSVLDIDFGDHVGDWEHTMVRFTSDGEPLNIYLSAHSSGTAYNYSTLINTTTSETRAVTYIATGTHANYATAGTQDYTFVGDLLTDSTDNGPIWDVTLNYRGYWFDNSTQTFSTAENGGDATDVGTDWLGFLGKWGDEEYPDSHSDQYCIFGECHWVDGPTGPVDKNLGRNAVCQTESGCTILSSRKEKIVINATRLD